MKGTLAMFNLAVSVVPPFSNVARGVYLQTGNTMKNLLALRQKKQEKLEQMNALLSSAENENRSFSDSEQTQINSFKSEVRNLSSQIEVAELLADEERNLIAGHKGRQLEKMPSNTELRNFVMTGESRSLSAGTDADGGYTVIPALDGEIYKLLRNQSVFRQNATVKTISSKTYEKLVSVGGTSAAWAAEGDNRGQTNTSNLNKVSWDLNSLYAYPTTTQELLDWSDFDVAGWLTSEVAAESGEKEEEAFWNGDGFKKPRGLLDYPTAQAADDARAFGTIELMTAAASASFTANELIALTHKLKRAYRNSSKFYMNDATQEQIRKLKDNDGAYIWRPGLDMGQPTSLLGKEIETAEQIPDGIIIYGDLARAYTVTDHNSGVRMLRDNLTSPGFVKMYTTRYVGGGLVDSNAVKILTLASS